jgi:hypothetical protein
MYKFECKSCGRWIVIKWYELVIISEYVVRKYEGKCRACNAKFEFQIISDQEQKLIDYIN